MLRDSSTKFRDTEWCKNKPKSTTYSSRRANRNQSQPNSYRFCLVLTPWDVVGVAGGDNSPGNWDSIRTATAAETGRGNAIIGAVAEGLCRATSGLTWRAGHPSLGALITRIADHSGHYISIAPEVSRVGGLQTPVLGSVTRPHKFDVLKGPGFHGIINYQRRTQRVVKI